MKDPPSDPKQSPVSFGNYRQIGAKVLELKALQDSYDRQTARISALERKEADVVVASSTAAPGPSSKSSNASGAGESSEVPSPPVPTERRNLKEEAMSLEHLCTHMPFNSHCRGCVEGKSQRAPKRKGGLVDQEDKVPTKFGDQVTADQGGH